MVKTSASGLCVHGTTVSLNGFGVLIRGASGSGKSDLALQLIDTAGTGLSGEAITGVLVADDQTEVFLTNGKVHARPPKTIAGKLEIRGFDVLDVPFMADVRLVLVVDLVPFSQIERLPAPNTLTTELLGQKIPKLDVDAASASAVSRVRIAFDLARLRDVKGR
jgi:HPr kinase/phosphorylase